MTPAQSLRSAFTALLDALPPSADLQIRLAAIRQRLSAEPDNNQVNELLGDITAIITHTRATAEEDRRNWEIFLIQLTLRLQQMEKIFPTNIPAGDAPAPERLNLLRNTVREISQQVTEWRQLLAQQGVQALSDPLTGIANRMAFEQRLRQEYARWKRYASPLVVQYWSVDEFESITQKHGRQAADMALVLVARIMTSSLRETDYIARYENETFAVLLPETMLDRAHVVAERLRSKIAGSRFHHQGEPVSVMISCGYAALEEGDTVPQLFQRLHEALARARTAGSGGYSAG